MVPRVDSLRKINKIGKSLYKVTKGSGENVYINKIRNEELMWKFPLYAVKCFINNIF